MSKLNIKFYEKRNIFFAFSIGVMLIGVIFNIIYGTRLDIQFTGGAVIKYSYVGEVNSNDIESLVQKATGDDVSVTINQNVKNAEGNTDLNNITIQFSGTNALELDKQQAIASALNEQYPDSNFKSVSSSSVNPTMGRSFFIKCLVAIAIAAIGIIIYVAIRFRKIGGTSAGVMAVVALIHDVLMVYFVFIIFRIPLNDSFIAVVLTILGYSVNDTIVVYDRIRENRRLYGVKEGLPKILNLSLNQVFSRSVYTSMMTFIAISTVFVVGMLYNINSIVTFALPMMVGVLFGCYSSLYIAGPLYTMWQMRKTKQKTAELAK